MTSCSGVTYACELDDDSNSGRVKPIEGEEAFRKLREKSQRRRSAG
jgi:hypothetical protein